jgi:hypothetical protein
LLYEVRDKHEVTAYVDSDWAKCPTTRKSTDCVCLYINGCLLYFSVKTQGFTALSSAEAELAGIHRGAINCIFIQNMLNELGSWFLGEKTLKVYSDSSAARSISNRIGIGRLKHLEIRQIHIQQLTSSGRLATACVKGENNVADIGTKQLDRPRIDKLSEMLRIVPWDPVETTAAVNAMGQSAKGAQLSMIMNKLGLALVAGFSFVIPVETTDQVAVLPVCALQPHEVKEVFWGLPWWLIFLLLWCLYEFCRAVVLGVWTRKFRGTSSANEPLVTTGARGTSSAYEPLVRVGERGTSSASEPLVATLENGKCFFAASGTKYHSNERCSGLNGANRSNVLSRDPCALCIGTANGPS